MIMPNPKGGIILHARGRDLEEIKKAFKWDSKLMTWILDGDAKSASLSQPRKLIIQALEEAYPKAIKPKEIWQHMRQHGYIGAESTVRTTLRQMARDPDVCIVSDGSGGYEHCVLVI